MKKALKITLGILVVVFIIVVLVAQILTSRLRGKTIFTTGQCYREDEFGVVYRVTGSAKHATFGDILVSEKYPSQYVVGSNRSWPSDKNPQKLYPVKCPE